VRSRGVATSINLGSLCREPPKLILFALGNPGNEGAPALAGGGEMVRKDTFDLKLSLRLAGSPPPSTEGGKFSVVALNVGRLSCSRRFVGEGKFCFNEELHPSGLRLPPSSAEEGYRKATLCG